MELSAAGLALIKKSEGFRPTIYRDQAGFPTIGYGHKLVKGEDFPQGLTEPEASAILLKDVSASSTAVLSLVKVPLTQGQFDALVDFTFNLGSGRLASSTLLKCLNCGRYDAAASQLLKWDMAGGQVDRGLQTRRAAELSLWQGHE